MIEHGERAGRWRIVVGAALLCLAGSSVAEPCSVVIVKHEPDAAERQTDRQPPAQVTGNVVRVLRGTRAGTSCDNTGLIVIEITGAKDDRTPREKIGYRITHVAGTLPYGVSLPSYVFLLPVAAGDVSREVFRVTLPLPWGDRATGDQESIDFTLAVVAVDLAGNESAPSSPIRVRHPGGKPDR
jgi:hypothetical protein